MHHHQILQVPVHFCHLSVGFLFLLLELLRDGLKPSTNYRSMDVFQIFM